MSGTLLHICCASCSIACIDTLRQEGIEPVGFWYNPNIHPMKEYKMRKNTLVEYAKSIDLKLEIENEYGLRKFIEAVYPNWDNRCATCYALRFEETAREAKKRGFDTISTTLTISPYQLTGVILEELEAAAARHGLNVDARDFRDRYQEATRISREKGMYRQNYCGCRFSIAEAQAQREAAKMQRDQEKHIRHVALLCMAAEGVSTQK